MLLSELQEFEWLNEPQNVIFRDKVLQVTAEEKTDFWQSRHRHYSQDNGHFFFSRKSNNFSFVVQWSFAQIKLHAQCGIMLRIDEKNWLKASIIYDNPERPMIGTSVTQNGYSDWAAQDIPDNVNNIWFKIKRNNGEDTVYYSLDGVKFKPIRLVYMQQNTDEVKVGAYICSPENTGFDATLSQLSFEY